MAEQQEVSLIAMGLGAAIAEAFEAAKDAPVEFGQQRLPGGIENGVAQLTTMSWSTYKTGDNKGKPFFRAAGVVVEGVTDKGTDKERSWAGQQTSIMIPLHATPNRQTKTTLAHHYADFLNVFKQFQVSMPDGMRPGESREAMGARVDAYFKAAAKIMTDPSKPLYFAFRTWQGKKQTTGPYAGKEPIVNEEWQGLIQYSPAPEPTANGAIRDHTLAPAGANPTAPIPTTLTAPRFEEPPMTSRQTTVGGGTFTAPPAQAAPAPFPTPAATPAAAPPVAPPPPPIQAAPAPEPSGPTDWSELGLFADDDPNGATAEGKAAVFAIQDAAMKAGLTAEQIGGAASWSAVAEWLAANEAAQSGAVVPTDVPAEAPVAKADPKKDDLVTYNGVLCRVSSVATEARTVTLKEEGGAKKTVVDPTTKKLAKISFDQLVR